MYTNKYVNSLDRDNCFDDDWIYDGTDETDLPTHTEIGCTVDTRLPISQTSTVAEIVCPVDIDKSPSFINSEEEETMRNDLIDQNWLKITTPKKVFSQSESDNTDSSTKCVPCKQNIPHDIKNKTIYPKDRVPFLLCKKRRTYNRHALNECETKKDINRKRKLLHPEDNIFFNKTKFNAGMQSVRRSVDFKKFDDVIKPYAYGSAKQLSSLPFTSTKPLQTTIQNTEILSLKQKNDKCSYMDDADYILAQQNKIECERKSLLDNLAEAKPGDKHIAWHFAVHYDWYVNNEKQFMEAMRENMKFFCGQEEMSVAGYHHIQIYCESKNREYYGSLKRKRGIDFIRAVQFHCRDELIRYVTKQETRVMGGIKLNYGDAAKMGIKRKASSDNIWTQSMNKSNVHEALKLIKMEEPEKYLTKKKVLIENLTTEYGNITEKPFIRNFNKEFLNFKNNKTKILIGPTGIGKTTLALANFKNPTLITSRQQFNRVVDDHNICSGIVIDDLNLKSWNCMEVLHLVDMQFPTTIDIKYGSVTIPAGLPRIITCNTLSSIIGDKWEDETIAAIKRRVDIIECHNELYTLVAPEEKRDVEATEKYINENNDYQYKL